MNVNPLLSRFMDLVIYDQSVNKIEDQIDVLVESIFSLEEEHIKNRVLLEEEKEHVRELKKAVDAAELDMKLLDEKVRQAKAKFSTASNAREYEVLKKDVEKTGQEQNAFEDTLLAAWAHFEAAQKAFQTKEVTIQERITAIEQTLETQNKEKAEIEIQLDVKRLERQEKEAGLPEQWVRDYTRMRRSVTNPVVPLENTSCSACFESLSANEILAVKRKQLSPCRGCFRFLFIQ